MFNTFCRYNSSAHVVDFLADNSLETTWQSESGESSVSVTLGLNTSISLSKIFIHFESPLPLAVELQYYHSTNATWQTLQYYADDCVARFNMPNDSE